jgi:hypothetical protein
MTPVLASSQQSGTALPGRSGLSSLSDDGTLVTFTNLTNEGTGSDHYQIYLKTRSVCRPAVERRHDRQL